MQILYSVLSFIVAIGVLVTVHEFGHFWVARRVGVKVLRFSVGFGRPLWSRRSAVDDTEYVLAAIPLGGYVKMLDEAEGDVPAHDAHRAFNRQPLWKRVAIVLAGPGANFLFAIVAYALMFMIGVSGMMAVVGDVRPGSVAARAGIETGDQIVAVNGREVAAWENAIEALVKASLDAKPTPVQVRTASSQQRTRIVDLSEVSVDDLTGGQFFDTLGMTQVPIVFEARIGRVQPGGPAERDGLLAGDLILQGDGEPIANWTELVRFIEQRAEQPVMLQLRRDGVERTLSVTPGREQYDGRTVGKIKAEPEQAAIIAGLEQARERYSVNVQFGPLDALRKGAAKTLETSVLTLRMFWRMLTGDVSLKNLSGPISIAQYTSAAAQRGLSRFLQILAIVSIGLGILNLLPVPLLDGGHLLYYAAETVLGRPLSDAAQFAGQRVGIALLVGLMGLAFYNDLSRLFG